MSYNLAELFESVVDTVPDREAIVSETSRVTYQALDQRANRLAHALRAGGIKAGDKVGLHLRNCSEYIEGMLAAFKLSAVPININFHYVQGELQYLYDNADLVGLIVHKEFSPAAYAVADGIESLQSVYVVDDKSGVDKPDEWQFYEDVLAEQSNQRDFNNRSSDDIYMVYTGGTTGKPKGVMWRHEDIFFAAMGGGDPDRSKGPITEPEQLPSRIFEFDVGALPTPPFIHAAAQWLAMNELFSGAKIVIPEGNHFDAVTTLKAATDEKVMLIVIVGDAMATPIIAELQKNPSDYDLSSLFVIASGGALFSPSMKKQLLELLPGRIILDGLGSSETGAMGNKMMMDSDNDDAEPHFVVSEGMTVLDENLKPVEPGSGVVGRLAKKGHLPLGYYKAPKKSAETFVELNGERWALPGDMASIDADGSILLMGRESTCINTGGEKVFPEEVEAVLKSHADINDTLVVGKKDERFGEHIVAIVESVSQEPLSLKAIQDYCRLHLANFKLPRELVVVDKIERTAAGKANYKWAMEVANKHITLGDKEVVSERRSPVEEVI